MPFLQIKHLDIPSFITAEHVKKIDLYITLLLKWNKHINLTSRLQKPDDLAKHFYESFLIFPHIADFCKTLVDLGSGNGFPGVLLAILGENRFHTHLIEAHQKKAVFLKHVSRETNIKMTIHNERIENLKGFPAECITARALAKLPELLDYSEKFLTKNSQCLFLKAENYKIELTQAQKIWNIKQKKVILPKKHKNDKSNQNHKTSILLKLESLHRVS